MWSDLFDNKQKKESRKCIVYHISCFILKGIYVSLMGRYFIKTLFGSVFGQIVL